MLISSSALLKCLASNDKNLIEFTNIQYNYFNSVKELFFLNELKFDYGNCFSDIRSTSKSYFQVFVGS